MFVYIVSQVRFIKGYGDMYDILYTYTSYNKALIKKSSLEEKVLLEDKKGYKFEIITQLITS
jgi:hypothetical protein